MPLQRPDDTPFNVAARALTESLARGEDIPATVYLGLRAELTKRVPLAERIRSDTDELIDSTLDAFCARAQRGQIDPSRSGAYLATSLRNARITRYRREQRTTAAFPLDDRAGAREDDAVFRLLDSQAARQDVYDALAVAFRDRRATTVKVVLRWIRLAERDGKSPSLREVADVAQVSHATVAAALAEFRTRYLKRRSDIDG
jgi:hypothetical protein